MGPSISFYSRPTTTKNTGMKRRKRILQKRKTILQHDELSPAARPVFPDCYKGAFFYRRLVASFPCFTDALGTLGPRRAPDGLSAGHQHGRYLLPCAKDGSVGTGRVTDLDLVLLPHRTPSIPYLPCFLWPLRFTT